MKRLLCVLMVMIMAVLLVPTIANADEDAKISLHDGDKQIGMVEASPGQVLPTPPEGIAQGRKFAVWLAPDGKPFAAGESAKSAWNHLYIECRGNFVLSAAWIIEDEPEPEPVVVVEENKPEEKKPEEPHVHAEVWVEGTPATCTHTGLTDGSKCKWCGEVMKAQTEIPKIDHVYSMWVPNGSGKHYASCLYCGNKIDAACEKVQLPIKSTSGAAVILCPVCGDCSGATATAVKGLKVGEGAPYRGTLRVWNIDAGDGNKYLAVSFDRFGKIMQLEGEVSVTLPDDLKGTTAGVIGADGSVKTVQESNGTLKLDFTGSQVVVLKGN